MQTARSQRDEYNRWNDYDQTLAREGYYIPKQTASFMVACLLDGERVLDVGCGTGLVGAAMASAGWRGTLVGTDIAEKRLVQAKPRGYAALFQASAYHLPLQDASFDAVVSAGMVGLAGITSLYEMERVLRRGGILVVSVGCIKRRTDSVRKYGRALKLMDRWPGMACLMYRDMGSGRRGYAGEHFALFVLQKK